MKPFISFFFVLVLSFVAFGQTKKFSASVQLFVQSDDKELQNTAYSYLTRELRSLGDVVLVDSKPDITIRILLVRDRTKFGENLGHTLAVVVTKNYKCNPGGAKNKDGSQVVLDFDDFQDLRTYSGSDSTLRDNCEKLVTNFDTGILEPERKIFKILFK